MYETVPPVTLYVYCSILNLSESEISLVEIEIVYCISALTFPTCLTMFNIGSLFSSINLNVTSKSSMSTSDTSIKIKLIENSSDCSISISLVLAERLIKLPFPSLFSSLVAHSVIFTMQKIPIASAIRITSAFIQGLVVFVVVIFGSVC